MDAQRIATAQSCPDAAQHGTMAFPEIVATLIRSGFESYIVDYRRGTTTYFLPDGDSIMLENCLPNGTIAPQFDQVGVAAQIKWHRRTRPTTPTSPSART